MKRNLVIGLLVVCLVLSVGLVSQTAAQKQVKLTYFSWGLVEDVWGGYIRDRIAEYEAQHPEIKIEPQQVTYADMGAVFMSRCIAGVGPDMADFLFNSLPAFVEKGFLLNLNPFVEQEGPEFLKAWYENAIDELTYDGKLYGVPENMLPWVLVYNAKTFAEAGLDPCAPPKTTEKFVEYAKVLTRDTDGDGKIDQWGFGIPAKRSPGLYFRFASFLWSAGGDYLTEDLSSSTLNSPEALEGFKFFVELATKYHVVHPGATEMGAHDVRIAVAHRKVAMNSGSGFVPGIVTAINPELDAYIVLQFASLPSFGDKPIFTTSSMGTIGINAQTKHPQEAWDFIKYKTNYENQIKAWYVNGWISPRKDAAHAKEVIGDKFGRVLAENQPCIRFSPKVVEWPEIHDIATTAVQNALTGIQTAEEALLEAHNAVNELLSK